VRNRKRCKEDPKDHPAAESVDKDRSSSAHCPAKLIRQDPVVVRASDFRYTSN
jgi:hypothetical protein